MIVTQVQRTKPSSMSVANNIKTDKLICFDVLLVFLALQLSVPSEGSDKENKISVNGHSSDERTRE